MKVKRERMSGAERSRRHRRRNKFYKIRLDQVNEALRENFSEAWRFIQTLPPPPEFAEFHDIPTPQQTNETENSRSRMEQNLLQVVEKDLAVPEPNSLCPQQVEKLPNNFEHYQLARQEEEDIRDVDQTSLQSLPQEQNLLDFNQPNLLNPPQVENLQDVRQLNLPSPLQVERDEFEWLENIIDNSNWTPPPTDLTLFQDII